MFSKEYDFDSSGWGEMEVERRVSPKTLAVLVLIVLAIIVF